MKDIVINAEPGDINEARRVLRYNPRITLKPGLADAYWKIRSWGRFI